ncbi:MAG: potassium transporter TrkG [Clostridiales bacterium]|nr:potassium transporter TrkG [Clostridiales bacterium]
MQKSENAGVIGKMMILEGMILLIPFLVLPFYWNESICVWNFLIPAAISIGIGIIISRLKIKICFLNSNQTVVFAWLYGFLLASIPFYLHGGLTPVQALFESVSGFTTTGLSVLDVEKIPHIFQFYRSFLQYVGGVGFVMTMLLFVQGKESVDLYEAEGHPDKLMPNIGKTVKVIIMMYGFFLIIGTLLYFVFGMPLFDGLLHTMCALSTGGFSNRMDSIGYYHSLPIEVVTILLMLIGTTNFSLLLLLLKGKIKNFCQSSEIRFLVGIMVIVVPFMTLFLSKDNHSVADSLRLAVFNAFSATSTTGYATCSYSEWPETALALMILLMLIGGGIGSTAGGIKLGRVCILLKSLLRSIRKKMSPDRTVILSYYHRGTERELLERDSVEEAGTYAGSCLIIFVIGTIVLTFFSGCTLLEGAFEFASSLGTVGLSIGVTNMETSAVCLMIEMIGMVLGRLEIFVLLKAFCKNSNL